MAVIRRGRSSRAEGRSPRLGRPPLLVDDVPERVHCTLTSKQYDRAYALAQREGISIPEVLRRGLARILAEWARRD